ncbi:MAG: copper amine oxidase N-terminal domain-containing protein [Defluviitaleaceae bacterium]|nr:copper amine oxidase N-terminal domain-containing protein [Defluviitaleaceae bacterium]
MKQRLQGMVMGFLVAVLTLGVVTVFATSTRTIEVTHGVNVIIDGIRQNFDDDMQPFMSEGRTFLPLRAIADSLGLDVTWNGSTSTAYLSSNMINRYNPTIIPQHIPIIDGYTFGSVVNFDDLIIIFHDNIEWLTVDNRFNENHGSDVFRVPMSITNTRNTPHGLNMFFYTQFGIDGTQLRSINFAIGDTENTHTNQILPNVTLHAHMNFLYAGDGIYTVSLDSIFGRESAIQIYLPISK